MKLDDASGLCHHTGLTFPLKLNKAPIMKRRYRFLIMTAVLLALLAACASSTQKQSLDATLFRYESAIRWSQWDGAVEFLAPEYLQENPVTQLDLDRLRLFRVTQYSVRSVMPTTDGTTVRQSVEIRLFNRNRAVEQALIDQQEWRYDADSERWFLHSGLPDVTRTR